MHDSHADLAAHQNQQHCFEISQVPWQHCQDYCQGACQISEQWYPKGIWCNNKIIWHQNNVATSFWLHNDVIIVSRARWVQYSRRLWTLQVRSYNKTSYLLIGHWPWEMFQYPIRRLIHGDNFFLMGIVWYCTEIWQVPRQQCCWSACQISKWYAHFNTRSRNFETLRDLTKRRLFGY